MSIAYKTLREKFALELQALHISPKTKVIFPDELGNYTIYPFRNEHKKLHGFPDIDTWNTIIILIPTNSQKRLKQLICKYRVIDHQIYIFEKVFHDHWTIIARCLNAFFKNTHNEKMQKASDVVNLFWYNQKNSTATIQGGKITIKVKELTEEQKRMRSKRASAMDNPRIFYAYREGDNYFHDKSCKMVSRFTDEEFRSSDCVPAGMKRCGFCSHITYIRMGCGEDFKNYSGYERFFQEMGNVHNNLLQCYVEKYHGTFKIMDRNVMQLVCNGDTWRIERKETGRYVLYHNNYLVIHESERLFTDGFHVQDVKASSLSFLMNYIMKYSWNIGHNKAAQREEKEWTESMAVEEAVHMEEEVAHQKEAPAVQKEQNAHKRRYFRNLFSKWRSKLIRE